MWKTATCSVSAYKIENLIDCLRAVVYVVAYACRIVYVMYVCVWW